MTNIQNNTQSIENKAILAKIPEGKLHNEFAALEAAKDEEKPTTETEEKETEPIKCPIDVFPKKLQNIINEVCSVYNVPIDFYLFGMLACSSAIIGGSLRLKTPKGHLTKCSIYGGIVSYPTSSKSPSLKWCIEVLYKIEDKLSENWRKDLQDKQDKAQKGEIITTPRQSQIITQVTPETLLRRLSQSPRGITVFHNELTEWLSDMNKYNSGSKEGDHEINLWDDGGYVNKELASDNIPVKDAFKNTIGTTQNDRIPQFLKHGSSGLLQRLLWVFPDEKHEKDNYKTLDEQHQKDYNNFMTNIYDSLKGQETIETSQRAAIRYIDFCNDKMYSEIGKARKENDPVWEQTVGKLKIYCLRFALILEVINTPYNELKDLKEVSLETMEKAITLTKYFMRMGKKVFDYSNEIGINKNNLKGLAEKIYNALPESEFNTKKIREILFEKNITTEKNHNQWANFVKENQGRFIEKVKHGTYVKI
jgi:hypothetical protein